MADPLDRLKAALADRYRFERELGSGGMATVYLAEDLKLERKVAIKVLKPELAAVLGGERFLREVKITARLEHPHILGLHDSGEAGSFLYYVMPYVEGESLRDRLNREKQLPIEDAVQIAREVADALSYAHSHDVIHRDIKPENILLESGHAVVADFGIARAISAAGGDRLTETGLAIGTPSYMSPEQAAGEKVLDGRSDLYALGCVFFEMLAGQPPFTGPTIESVVRQHLTVEAPAITNLRPAVPDEVVAALTKVLAKNPADRFTTAMQMVEALETPVGSEAGPRGGRRTAVGVLAGATIALVASAVVWWTRDGNGPGDTAVMEVVLRQVTFSTGVEAYPALSPDGERLVFSRDVDGFRQLVLTRLEDGGEEFLTEGRRDNIQAAWTPDGSAILFVRGEDPGVRLSPSDVFADFTGGDVWRIDLASRSEELLVSDAYNPALSATGRVAVDASRGGTRRIWVMDERGRNARQISVDSSEAVTHVDPSWSPDGTKLVFQHIERTKFDIGVVEVGSGEWHRVTDDVFVDVNPVWSADGGAILFSSYRSGGLNLWRLPVDARGVPTGPAEQITTGAGQDVQLATSTTSNHLLFTVLRLNADLWRLPVDPVTGRASGEPQPVVVTTREDSRGAWSPDGATIAFNSDRAGDMNIWIHRLSDDSERQLTRGAGGDYQPNWSPDGSRLAFFSARAGNADIWAVDTASGRLTQLTESPWLDINPSYSPDGSLIAFQSDRQGRMEVWVMNGDGSDPRRMTNVGVGASHFLPWSEDGEYIYFRGIVAGDLSAMRVRVADGEIVPAPIQGGAHMSLSRDRTRVADVTGHRRMWISPLDGEPPYPIFSFDDQNVRIDYTVWSPDGRWILFDRREPEGGDIWLAEWR